MGKLAELGWLYRRIQSYVAKESNNRTIGLVGQVWFHSFYGQSGSSKLLVQYSLRLTQQ